MYKIYTFQFYHTTIKLNKMIFVTMLFVQGQIKIK
jgi:hypothetical protein